jgi:hypothetical protein
LSNREDATPQKEAGQADAKIRKIKLCAFAVNYLRAELE